MKKFVLISISILLFGCMDDDTIEMPNPPEDNLLLSISIPENYYEIDSNIIHSGHLYLTNSSGELIADGLLSNNITTELNGEFDIENNEYNATVLNKIESNGQKIYTIKTFVGIEPYQLEFKKTIYLNPNNETARIVLVNTGGLLRDIVMNNSFSSGGSGANGGVYSLNIRLRKFPDEVYVSFKNTDESFKRYLWLENLTGSTNDTINYEDVPVFSDSSIINYPNNDQLAVEIFGSQMGDLNKYFFLSDLFYENGSPFTTIYMPDIEFIQYKVITKIEKGGAKYQTTKVDDSIDLDYETPNLDLQVINNTTENYELISMSDYDFYSVTFRYFNSIEKYSVNWTFYGVKEETVTINFPELIDMIFEDQPNFTIPDLFLLESEIHKIEGIETYEQYIYTILDRNSDELKMITKSETISK